MTTISADKTFYTFSLKSHLVRSVDIHTNRVDVSKNYLALSIYRKYMNPESLSEVQMYISDNLSNFDARLITVSVAPNIPFYIKVADYTKGRGVIEYLRRSEQMSEEVASHIGPVLLEMEKDGNFANRTEESITVAQKEIIESMISPYIDSIKAGVGGNSEAAMLLISQAASELKMVCSEESLRKGFERLSRFNPSYLEVLDNDDLFFEDLRAVAKVYASIGNLEETFSQMGVTLPSERVIQSTVRSCFCNS